MNLKNALLLFAGALAWLSFAVSPAQAQWVGFGVGIPAYRPYPYYRPYYVRPYYPYYPYRYRLYAPAPVYVTPPRAYYYSQPGRVIQPNYYSYPTPAATAVPAPPVPGMIPITPPAITPVPPRPMTPIAPSTPPTFAPPAPPPPAPATPSAPPKLETIPALPGQP
jgi:hypothetical protein